VVHIVQNIHWFWLRTPLGSSNCTACTGQQSHIINIITYFQNLLIHYQV
jgi:hypothetical protein